MNDEKQPNPETNARPSRTPNREYRRTPPVIEGEATQIRAGATETASPAEVRGAPGGEENPSVTPAPAAQEPGGLHTLPGERQPETLAEAGAQTGPDASKNAQNAGKEASSPPEQASAEATASAGDPPPAASPSPASPSPASPSPAGETPPAKGYGYGALAAASLGSAALAAIAVYVLQSISAPAGPSPSALETRLAEVERRASAAPQAPQVSPAAIAALEKRVASVETIAAGAAEAARKAADAAARPAPAAAAAPANAAALPQEALTAIDRRIAALEKNASGLAPGLETRLDAVEKALAAPKAGERATETRVQVAPPPDLDPMRKQLAALEARLQTLEGQAAPLADAARAAEGRFKGLEERIQPLAGRLDAAQAQSEAGRKRADALAEQSADAARLSLAQSIVTALETGASFAQQVQALARLNAPSERLTKLTEAVKSGVLTTSALEDGLAALRPKIVARAEAPADASVVDRLTSSALGLVRVRPAGEATGDAPADIFARMSQALRRGDVAAALKERQTLPEQGRSASEAWAKQAQARLDAEQAARALVADLTQKLGRS